MNNIVLIGFMGAGKGSVGRVLADMTGKFTLDCDDLIESRLNKKIPQIFSEFGEAKFRQIEKDLAIFLQNNVQNAIISTGGGFYAVENLNQIGKVIYLNRSFESILQSIKSSPNADKKIAKRPLLSDLQKARELFDKRKDEYAKKADFIVHCDDKNTEQVAKEIINLLKDQI